MRWESSLYSTMLRSVGKVCRTMPVKKPYRRQNSFTAEELDTIWKVRHLPTKDVLDLFPRRSPAMIDYLRQKTGAYRVGYYKEEKCSTST